MGLNEKPIGGFGSGEASFVTLCDRIRDKPTEYASIAYLGLEGRVLDTVLISSPCPDLVALPVREIARRALMLGARRLIMAHNHPSGVARPSGGDIETTRRLSRALALFDMRLVDHWIVTEEEQVSLRTMGLM